MWFVTHIAFGGGLGALIKKPMWLIIILSLLSHILLDLIPHWDYKSFWGMRADLLFGFLLLFWLFYRNPYHWACFLGGFFAVLPDLEHFLTLYNLLQRYYFPSHLPIFPHGKADILWGSLLQIPIMGISLYLVQRYKRSKFLGSSPFLGGRNQYEGTEGKEGTERKEKR